MALGLATNGVVQRQDDGAFVVVRFGAANGTPTRIEVPPDLADAHRLWTGDVVEGATEARDDAEDVPEPDVTEGDPKPSSVVGPAVGRLVSVTRINGLSPDAAADRPTARTKRNHYERTAPDTLVTLATASDDETGRLIDFSAPLGLGCVGAILGGHGTGLTCTLRAVAGGLARNAPECLLFAVLSAVRGEEVTDWRRRFPAADVVALPARSAEGPAASLQIASLVIEAAQRQTELGRDVVVLVDSLTTLWGAMLEAEDADAQAEADLSLARQGIREWLHAAGCFHGEMPLGGSLGGSLTIIGTVWDQPVDVDTEEEREVHPHLRLVEQITPDLTWRVMLSEELARRRLYPAIDVLRCRSDHEERLLPAPEMECVWAARRALPTGDPLACYRQVMEAVAATTDRASLAACLCPD